jgi:hypothetical protein
MTVPEEKLAGKITDKEIKRVNYFDTQFLQEADFQDEQAYHIRLRRANNLAIHGWGIIAGLEIAWTAASGIVVTPGIAIDKFGREIILTEDSSTKSYDLSGFNAGDVVFLTITYDTATDEKDRNPSGETDKFIRTIERPKLEKSTTFINDGTAIVLGKVIVNAAGTIDAGSIDLSSRQIARSQTPPIVGIALNGANLSAPDGNSANWLIFVSLHKIEAPSKSIAQLEISAQPTPNGWVINCSGTDSADAILSGAANYMILRKFNN